MSKRNIIGYNQTVKITANATNVGNKKTKITLKTLSAAANIFVGQTEAPLVIRPYVSEMTRSELMAVMTGGFATVAGGVLAAYVRFGIDAGHLLAASVMSAPAALVIAKIIFPETKTPVTAGGASLTMERKTANVIDAAAAGAADGLKLALNVGAMLLAFIALVAMIDFFLGYLHTSLQQIFGYLFAPLAWCMGVPKEDILVVGNLLGTKITDSGLEHLKALTKLQALNLSHTKVTDAGLVHLKEAKQAKAASTIWARRSSATSTLGNVSLLAKEQSRLTGQSSNWSNKKK